NIYNYNRTSGERGSQLGGRVASPQGRPSRGITVGGVRGASVAQPRMAAPAQHSGGQTRPGGDIYAGSGGQVYRRSSVGGWQQQAGSNWQRAGAEPGLNREAQARALGEQRTQSFRAMGGLQGGSGGMGGRQAVAGPRPSVRASQSSRARKR
ncbi:MAG TPA: hypothetical protein VGR09_04295, partial [Gemmatimonadales bacterium]|nr:hypothetical protein [Gemmatimonadales bacterium]